MSDKLLVPTRSSQDAERVRATGATVLAEYPDSLLVRATDAQSAALTDAGLEAHPLPDPPVRTASATFDFGDAVEADRDAPVPSRYHVVQFVGPVKQEWTEAVTALGGSVHGGLAGFRMIVGLPPQAETAVAELPFVEGVAAYRPTMKVSPRLRPDVPGQALGTVALRGFSGLDAETTSQVQITVFEGEDADEVADAVRDQGGTVLSVEDDTVLASVPGPALEALAEQPGVAAIMPHAFPTFNNDRAAAIMRVPVEHENLGKTLTGAGQIVGVIDSGCDTGVPATIHPDLAGRVTVVSSPNVFAQDSLDPRPFDDGPKDETSHGTHVCGSVAGNGAAARAAGSSVVPSGIAPEARLHMIAIGQRVTWKPEVLAQFPTLTAFGLWGLPPGNVGALLEVAYRAGARIHTNSWGSAHPSVAGTYNEQARSVDRFMATHRDALVIFSAGNEGKDEDDDVQIDAGSITPPATAKNCLTVGATESNRPHDSVPRPVVDADWTRKFPRFAKAGHISDKPGGMALFSSRGPTDDGRVKPEVVAPGTNILSTRSAAFDAEYIGEEAGTPPLWGDVRADAPGLKGKYCFSGGTSMATPLVAGAAALVRQYLVDERGHHPSGALLKAFLVNGATPIPGQYQGEVPTGPNNVSGFGRVDVTASVVPSENARITFGDFPGLAVRTQQTRTFRVSPAGGPLKVTLTWTDVPSPSAEGGLQNKLYLRVRPVDGGPAVDGDVTPVIPTNPTQQVVIAEPTGDYFIDVTGFEVRARSAGDGAPPGAVQDFALVVANAVSTFGFPDLLNEPVEP